MFTTCLLSLFLGAVLQASAHGDDPPFKMTAEEQELVKLTNAERKLAKLEELEPNAKLFQSARLHAANMAKQNKFDHELDGKSMLDRLQATGYGVETMGENIYWNKSTPRKVLASWMESEGHKKNILTEDFIHIGVAVARNAKGEPYWVQVFAAPLVK